MGKRKTKLRKRSIKVDPTYYLTNQGTGYTSLWKLVETAPAEADDTTTVTAGKNDSGYWKVIPGTDNDVVLTDLPTDFDKYGWRSEKPLNGDFDVGDWAFHVTIVTGKYVVGQIDIYGRLWKSANADGSGAVAITDWFSIASISSPSANTVYNVSGTVSLAAFSLSNEYLFVEYAIGVPAGSECSSATGCQMTFRCNEGDNQKIVTTAFTPAVTVNIVAMEFPMNYLAGSPKELISSVTGATYTKTAKSLPEYHLKKGTAQELRSKWE